METGSTSPFKNLLPLESGKKKRKPSLPMYISPLEWSYTSNASVSRLITDQSATTVYTDKDKDGFYDRMDLYEDYLGGVYGDGINDQHLIDYDNDGAIDRILGNNIIFQVIRGEQNSITEIWQKIRTETVIEHSVFGDTMTLPGRVLHVDMTKNEAFIENID